MAKIITPSELRVDCELILSRAHAYNSITASVIAVLLQTGCREAEALDRSRWSLKSDGSYILQPGKRNPSRAIPASQVNTVFAAYLAASGLPSSLSSRNNLRRLSRIFSQYPNATCGDKGISSHRFRHNKIKQLSAQGSTIPEIKIIMGLVSSSIVQAYIDSTILA